jgi:uncharacterized protein YegL
MTSIPNILGGNAAAVLGTHPGSLVNPAQAGRTRTPILFLIDTSGSTGEGTNPDLPQIERALCNMVELLRQPPSQNALATSATVVDIAIVSYANEPKLVQPWEQANKLAAAPSFNPLGGTNTGSALIASLEYIARRLKYYDDNKPQPIPKNIPHIFHFTDGAPTDVEVGNDMWLTLQDLLQKVSSDKDKPFSMISHFVAPNGMTVDHGHVVDELGNKISGYDALSRWMGTDYVFELMKAPDMFNSLIRIILKSVGGSTTNQGRINDLIHRYNIKPIRGASILGQTAKKTGTDG